MHFLGLNVLLKYIDPLVFFCLKYHKMVFLSFYCKITLYTCKLLPVFTKPFHAYIMRGFLFTSMIILKFQTHRKRLTSLVGYDLEPIERISL